MKGLLAYLNDRTITYICGDLADSLYCALCAGEDEEAAKLEAYIKTICAEDKKRKSEREGD